MKIRQFITIIAVILIWFIYFWYRISNMQDYLTNIDENVATVDARILDMSYRIKYVEDKL